MNRLSISLIAMSLLLGTTGIAATNGAKITYQMEATQGPQPMKHQATYYISQGSVRIEMDSKQSPMGNMVVIRQAKPKRSFILYPSQKSYMETTQHVETAKSTKTEPTKNPFKPTGKKKKIAGHECKVESRTTQLATETICTSKSLMRELGTTDLFSSLGKGDKSSFPKGFPGFPLEFVRNDRKSGNVHARLRVTSVNKQNLKKSLFTIPKGYKQSQNFPNMGNMPKNMPSNMQMPKDFSKKSMDAFKKQIMKQYGQSQN